MLFSCHETYIGFPNSYQGQITNIYQAGYVHYPCTGRHTKCDQYNLKIKWACNAPNYTPKILVMNSIYGPGITGGYSKNGYTRPLIKKKKTIQSECITGKKCIAINQNIKLHYPK